MTADEQTIEALQQQLLEAQESSRHMLLRAQGAEAERDALAAHVQKMRDVIQLVCEQAFTPVPKDAADALEGVWYEKSSIDTLLRLKAEWQVEALQELYNKYSGHGMIRRGALLDMAIELQNDAEEAT